MAKLAVVATFLLAAVVAAATIPSSANGGRLLEESAVDVAALAPTGLDGVFAGGLSEEVAAPAPAELDREGDLANKVPINFVLLISRQGKVRLTKWYSPYTQKERTKVIRELSGLILTRGPKLCNFVEWRGYKVVYRRYASLYFCMCIDAEDNELEVLEIIHHFVEILDRYFGSVCELDLIFNFHKAYYILDEILIAGELQESSKKNVARLIAAQPDDDNEKLRPIDFE
uniref:Adaptor AP-1 19 kDa protein n=1 Tax=Leersia perrieri TaxID=77586 RepID=A0A0D9VZT3_9ORYZ